MLDSDFPRIKSDNQTRCIFLDNFAGNLSGLCGLRQSREVYLIKSTSKALRTRLLGYILVSTMGRNEC